MQENAREIRVCEGLVSSGCRELAPEERVWLSEREAKLRVWKWLYPGALAVSPVVFLAVLAFGASGQGELLMALMLGGFSIGAVLILAGRDRRELWLRTRDGLQGEVESFSRDDEAYASSPPLYSSDRTLDRLTTSGEVISRDGLHPKSPEFALASLISLPDLEAEEESPIERKLGRKEMEELRGLTRFPRVVLAALFFVPYGGLAVAAMIKGTATGVTLITAGMAILLGVAHLISAPLALRSWIRLRRDLRRGVVKVDGTDELLPHSKRWWRESSRPTEWRAKDKSA